MVDYSKWKDIEISDDEDETHPNIDTPSLFRWRHQARLERMEDQKKEKEAYERKKVEFKKKVEDARKCLADTPKESPQYEEIKKIFDNLEKEEQEIKKKEEELKKKEKTTPWNVDTISKPGFTKTVFNTKPQSPKDENLTEEEREAKMKQFIKENEKTIKEFGMLRKYDDSKQYLQQHNHLACEETANYLVIWCINLEMEDKTHLMEHVAHQTICMQYILELSKQLDIDPRACIGSFFDRIQTAEKTYKDSFDDELTQFKLRIKRRAKEKIELAIKEQEEEERQARLGPGGLDPVEVYEELPESLRKCFDAKDIPMLQETISKMPEQEAIYFMKRCVDSGLWVPGKSDDEEPTLEKPTPDDKSPAPVSTTEEVD